MTVKFARPLQTSCLVRIAPSSDSPMETIKGAGCTVMVNVAQVRLYGMFTERHQDIPTYKLPGRPAKEVAQSHKGLAARFPIAFVPRALVARPSLPTLDLRNHVAQSKTVRREEGMTHSILHGQENRSPLGGDIVAYIVDSDVIPHICQRVLCLRSSHLQVLLHFVICSCSSFL